MGAAGLCIDELDRSQRKDSATNTASAEISDLEMRDLEAAWYADSLRDGIAGAGDPVTDQELWRHIKYVAGGIRRSRDFWDNGLSWRENRAAFRYLDRGWELGRPMDELADEIGAMWPWFGIHDADGLYDWMQRTRRC